MFHPTSAMTHIGHLPHFVVLDMEVALDILDRLAGNVNMPTIDVDAVMSAILQGLELDRETVEQHEREKLVRRTLETLMDSYAAAFADQFVSRYPFEQGLRMAMNDAYVQLKHHRLYQGGMLLYDYEKRRDKEAVVLVRKRQPSFEQLARLRGARC